MNPFSEQEIEALLRQPPKPRAPGELKHDLIARARSAPKTSSPQPSAASRLHHGWLRRWWPALAPASIALFCAVVMAVQQREIRELKESLQAASSSAATVKAMPVPETGPDKTEAAIAEAQEIARLKDVVARLTGEIAQLEQVRVENQALRTKLDSGSQQFTPEEMEGMQEMHRARGSATRVACANNMKRLALAARLWSSEHNELLPTEVLQMTGEISTPKILRCPGDESRAAADSWESYTPANNSYEYLAPGGSEAEPTRILFRCPIHNNIGLCDGSVQAAGTNTAAIVQRDGKLYFEPHAK